MTEFSRGITRKNISRKSLCTHHSQNPNLYFASFGYIIQFEIHKQESDAPDSFMIGWEILSQHALNKQIIDFITFKAANTETQYSSQAYSIVLPSTWKPTVLKSKRNLFLYKKATSKDL